MWRDTSAFGGALSSTRALLACPCCDGTVHILSTASARLKLVHVLNIAAQLQEAIMCICAAFSPSGDYLAVLGGDGTVLAYDVRTWKATFSMAAPPGTMDAEWLSEVPRCPSVDFAHLHFPT